MMDPNDNNADNDSSALLQSFRGQRTIVAAASTLRTEPYRIFKN